MDSAFSTEANITKGDLIAGTVIFSGLALLFYGALYWGWSQY